MSTANFRTQSNFPLYCYDDSDMEYWEAEDFFSAIKEELDALNSDLTFYQITLRSGYYCGVQFYVEMTSWADEAGFDEDGATRWADNESCRYYLDMYLSEAKRKFETETRKVNRLMAKMADAWGFEEYVCVARFSNGEAMYAKASNKRARLKAAAIA